MSLRGPAEIGRWLERTAPDVVVTNTAVASYLARVRRRTEPVVYFCHGLHWNSGRRFSDLVWRGLERSVIRNTAGVVTINSDDTAWFSRYLSDRMRLELKGGVGVPLEDYPRTPLPSIDGPVEILWAGEFSERKRPWLAVEVVSNLIERGHAVHLTMCGSGALLSATRDLIARHGLAEQITLPGQVVDIGERLERAHALLMTSIWEGLPRIGLEAIVVGRPVFAFDVKGVRSLPTVELANDGDIDDLARHIAAGIDGGLSGLVAADIGYLSVTKAADDLANFLHNVTEVSGWEP